MRALAALFWLVVGAGCQGGVILTGQSSGSGSGTSSAGSSTGTNSGSTTASGVTTSGSSAGATSTTGGTSTGAATTTGGTSTGEASPFFDGGYVSCAVDAGASRVRWMCQPGTYSCETPGNCAQCLSDADCANAALPTYDRKRQRCDLDSGVAGYQNFCQQCLGNPDCAATPATPQCNLDANDLEPRIETTGFETCTNLADAVRCTPEVCGGPTYCDLDSGDCSGGGGDPPCTTDYDCSLIELLCDQMSGYCTQCLSDQDCILDGFAAQGGSYCSEGRCTNACVIDADCNGNLAGPHCVDSPFGTYCGCGTDQDCAASPDGPHCVTDAGAAGQGSCFCGSASECPAGESCRVTSGRLPICTSACILDSDCLTGYFCPNDVCQPRCDDGGAGCLPPDLVCDTENIALNNYGGEIFCYGCLIGDDCPEGVNCNGFVCDGGCTRDPDCHSGEVCAGGACQVSCDAGPCPAGQICDTDGTVVNRTDVCYPCRSAEDCGDGQGCRSSTHTCGACDGPTASGGPFDCPPDAVCSNYWAAQSFLRPTPGVCLQNCDNDPCLNPNETCQLLPGFTPDHEYCFGCVRDSDCADAGPGAWCDTSLGRTFSCKPGPRP